MEELQKRLIGFYRQELDRQSENRCQMAIDEDFYDSIQWSEHDAKVLADRGQAPIAYNVLAQSINWIIGTEKRGRTDFKVYPRGPEDAKPAQTKTEYLKYLSDVNRTPFHRSRAFEDAAKVGLGWLEDGIASDDDGDEPIYSRYESWRNMLWDSASTELDLSDCRYITRSKFVDVDVAKALAPDRADVIELAKMAGSAFGHDMLDGDDAMDNAENERASNIGVTSAAISHLRERVRLIEVWFRRMTEVTRMQGGAYHGLVYEPYNKHHVTETDAGRARLIKKPAMRMYVALMTTEHMLYCSESPYRHNEFPFTPIWCYRYGRNGLPYGYIRGLRDIQEDINKRASKSLAILSSNKVIMDDDAVDDMEELRDELAKPNGIIKKKKNRQLEINADRELSDAHMDMMNRSIGMVQQVSGVTDELLGRTTNAVSGKAVQARQDQGSLATAKIYDNRRFAAQVQGEKQLSLMEQFVTEQKVFRITNSRGKADFVTINDGMPENDITRTKADFVIGEADWHISMRQAGVDQLTEMMSRLPPQIALMLMDLVVEMMDLPNSEEIVKRIRQSTGMKDPNADPNTPPTPEEQAAAAATQQQQQIQDQMMVAQLRKLVADAIKAEAVAKTETARAVDLNVNAQAAAIQGAREIVLTPGVAPIADSMLADAGLPSAQIPVPAQPVAPELPAQQPAQPAQQGMPAGLPATQ